MCAAEQEGVLRMARSTAAGEPGMAWRPRQRGMTYLVLLWWVAISSVMLAALGQGWSVAARREREIDMVFRGEQIRRAIEAYAKVPVAQGESPWPKHLDDLLADERQGRLVRHLRKVQPDPITGRDWVLIKQGEGIVGVYSASLAEPLAPPEGVTSYAAWQFKAEGVGESAPQSTTRTGGGGRGNVKRS